ncbi:MAG: hypothetical protein H8E36_15275 [Rhodospirillaceae bacterium]|nr:hypothetical protein [Rhodospirillaceae bacterium]MBL6929893.1 hypothetical protein [Rhodospirillales bacterium]MBL6941613.1 hypothetical protein [Rhodospirillales bacterium]
MKDEPKRSKDRPKDRSDIPRRSHKDRRHNVAPWEGVERRVANRRKAFHRREDES